MIFVEGISCMGSWVLMYLCGCMCAFIKTPACLWKPPDWPSTWLTLYNTTGDSNWPNLKFHNEISTRKNHVQGHESHEIEPSQPAKRLEPTVTGCHLLERSKRRLPGAHKRHSEGVAHTSVQRQFEKNHAVRSAAAAALCVCVCAGQQLFCVWGRVWLCVCVCTRTGCRTGFVCFAATVQRERERERLSQLLVNITCLLYNHLTISRLFFRYVQKSKFSLKRSFLFR